MTFDLRQLRAFTTIAASGSLGRAADALHVTQPALSRILKRLEEQIGAPLFERHSKGVQLTAIGEALLPHATLLQHEAEHAREEIDALRGLAKGTIKVGAVGSIASFVLPVALGRVLDRWPNLRVVIVEGVWDRLVDALLTHEIDIALSTRVPDTDEVVAIAECRWDDVSHVVAAPDHPLRAAARAPLTLADTRAARWAIPPRGTAPFEQMRAAFDAHGLAPPDIAVETRSVTALKSLVAHAGFLSWMAEPMYRAERRARTIDTLAVEGVAATRTLTAFRRRHGILPGPAARLLEALALLTREPL
ncbi:LysR family transcriptional regulator [Burkholderia pseudomallei]|uniref:LysR family transcriptional regulator n=1 Tax=Burkholderia pseudomallei TaxID=28450 RepID=UPI00050E6191|nr:LysR family transcriptional regulator [Burkholderia pseudomallei]KGC37821.1 bacterial regulatory helix-turn-helix, lysR family protein [Burkholderia pseudomallei]